MRVLQLIDSLHPGGAERMAVNLANGLAETGIESYVCVTRKSGSLEESLTPKIKFLTLNKRRTLDYKAIKRLANYIRKEKIELIHAHTTSVFTGVLAKMLTKRVKLIWHDHHGNRVQTQGYKRLVLKILSLKVDQIISVNKQLKAWSEKHLYCSKVSYVPNFPMRASVNIKTREVYGTSGKRLICLANLRPQKDHITLIKAFERVNLKYPEWTLHCIGSIYNDTYSNKVLKLAKDRNLEKHIFFYGQVSHVQAMIDQCTIGILSSVVEGLPLALLEYGLGKLGVIATDVGECGDVISKFGLLVDAKDEMALSKAILSYIENPMKLINDAEKFHHRVLDHYGKSAIIDKVVKLYLNKE